MKLNDFTMSYKESDNQSNTFTYSHTRYDVTIKYDGREITIKYQCNPTYCGNPTLGDVLECLLSDAYAYQNSADVSEFMEEFGYENAKEARRIYNGCKDNFEKLCYLLDSEDCIEEWNSLIEN